MKVFKCSVRYAVKKQINLNERPTQFVPHCYQINKNEKVNQIRLTSTGTMKNM